MKLISASTVSVISLLLGARTVAADTCLDTKICTTNDFSAVRIHACSDSAGVVGAIGSIAFTRGTAPPGPYNPANAAASATLAAEIAQVVQGGKSKIWQPLTIIDYGPLDPDLLPGQLGPPIALASLGAQAAGTVDPQLAGFGWGLIEPEQDIAYHPAIGHISPFGIARAVVYPPTANGLAELELAYEVATAPATIGSVIDLSAGLDPHSPNPFIPGGFISSPEAHALDTLAGVQMRVLQQLSIDGVSVVRDTLGARLDAAGLADAIAAFEALIPIDELTARPDDLEYRAQIGTWVEHALLRMLAARLSAEDSAEAALAELWDHYAMVRRGPLDLPVASEPKTTETGETLF